MTITEQTRIPEVLDADARQHIFRVCLEALARPGTHHVLTAVAPSQGEATNLPVTAAPIAALADLLTPIAAADEGAQADLERLCALTHAPVGRLEEARFVLAYAPLERDQVLRFNRGTNLRPHRAALVCMPVTFGSGSRLRFTGPGVDGRQEVQIAGLDRGFVEARAEVVAQFPRGIDFLLIDSAGAVMGLPRTTAIEELS